MKVVYFFKILPFVFLLYVFVSCSDSTPKIDYAEGFVVFDFQEGEIPFIKLSAFVETSGNVRRGNSIKIVSQANGYEWTVKDPIIFAGGSNEWAGYTDFVCPDNKLPPAGMYRIVYTDAESREAFSTFGISYPENFFDYSESERQALFDEDARKFIGIYSDKMLLYYGERRKEWVDDTSLFLLNNKASHYRDIYELKTGTLLCLMKPVFKSDVLK